MQFLLLHMGEIFFKIWSTLKPGCVLTLMFQLSTDYMRDIFNCWPVCNAHVWFVKTEEGNWNVWSMLKSQVWKKNANTIRIKLWLMFSTQTNNKSTVFDIWAALSSSNYSGTRYSTAYCLWTLDIACPGISHLFAANAQRLGDNLDESTVTETKLGSCQVSSHLASQVLAHHLDANTWAYLAWFLGLYFSVLIDATRSEYTPTFFLASRFRFALANT